MNETTLSDVGTTKHHSISGCCLKIAGLLCVVGLALVALYSQELWGSNGILVQQQQGGDHVKEYTISNRTYNTGAEGGLHQFNLCRNKPGLAGYRCRGPEYSDFAGRLEAYIYQNLSLVKPPLWGKRQTPFPPNSTILLVGNSHSRQLSDAFRCQWVNRDRQSAQRIYPYEAIAENNYEKLSYVIDHYPMGVTVHSLVNHPFPYSIHWKTDLEAATELSLSSFDGIILGQFNGYVDSINTTFFYDMTEALKDRKDASLGHPPPNISAFANNYEGPIVGHGMFATRGIRYFTQMTRIAASLNRDNIRLVDSRAHVPVLGEGASNKRMFQIGKCTEYPGGHRCTGPRGGHPDLMAWEVSETMYELLEK